MDDRIENILKNIRQLEDELLEEMNKKKKEFLYEVHERRVRFSQEVKAQHKKLYEGTFRYIAEISFRNLATAPIIGLCMIAATVMDLVVSLYQFSCFPVYGIPKVRRSEYIIVDRQYLSYLNPLEKISCVLCGYFNGVIAYVQEVAARTEQHWCPVKHARKMMALHSRYENFIDYGDAVGYRKDFEKVRNSFDDIS
jgi:ElaB/YqjD/DUF883 family membrane-anchored ribosome-binding protein